MKLVVCSDAFVPADQEGGPPFSTATLCKGLAAAGAEVRVITTNRNGRGQLPVPADEWTTHDGLSVSYARSMSGLFYPAPSARRALDVVRDADGVIGSGTLWTHLGWLASQAAHRHGKPFVLIPRGLMAPWALAYKPLRKRVYWQLIAKRIVQRARAVVALTEHERQALHAFGVTTRTEVIPNGIRVDEFANPSARASVDAWFPDLAGRAYVLFLGRVHDGKGLPQLVAALDQPNLANRDVRLVVAGPVDSHYQNTWNQLLASSAQRGRILPIGPVSGERKAALLAHASVFVLPSLSEALPVAVLEALASGCATVLTPACNLPEVAQAGAGIEVGPDAGQLAGAIARLLNDDDLRQEMGRRGRTLAAGRFDWQAVGRKMLALCADLAARDARRSAT